MKIKAYFLIIIIFNALCGLQARERTPLTDFFDPILGNWYGAVHSEWADNIFSYEYIKIGYKFEDIVHIELFSKPRKDILSYVRPNIDGNGYFISSEVLPVNMEGLNIYYDRSNNYYIGFSSIRLDTYIGRPGKGDSMQLLTLPSFESGIFLLESPYLHYELSKSSLNTNFIIYHRYAEKGEYLRAYTPLNIDLAKETKEAFSRFNFFNNHEGYEWGNFPKTLELYKEFENGKLDSPEYEKLRSSIANYIALLKQFSGEWNVHGFDGKGNPLDNGKCWIISDEKNLTLFSKLPGPEGEYYFLKNIFYSFDIYAFYIGERQFSIIEGHPLKANGIGRWRSMEAREVDLSKGLPSEILFAKYKKNPKSEECLKWVFSDDYKTIFEYTKNGTDDWILRYIYNKIPNDS